MGSRTIAAGSFAQVRDAARNASEYGTGEPVLIFDDDTGEQTEVEPVRAGRPKLGVIAREVTLLPRHWEWLGEQPGGASVTLRRLVDDARRASEGKDRTRKSRQAAYRIMTALAGNEPGYEEAIRALFAGDVRKFAQNMKSWPKDVRDYAKRIAAGDVE
jgi:hypothetical protein